MTFLEPFFDLVFVVVISQLAHRLAEHPSWPGVGWFVFQASLTSMVVLLLAPEALGLVVWLRRTDPSTVGFS